MMKSISFYFLAVLFLVCASANFTTATAQSKNAKVERAKRYMKDLNYIGAIEILNGVLAQEDNAEAKINLAECYRKVSDTENAEFIYGQVVRLPEAQPIHYLYYGEMLQRNGKCDLAKEWYAKFAEAVPEDARGQYLNKACAYEEELKNKNAGIYEVKRTAFNSTFDDFGATFYKDGIVFASERDKSTMIKRSHSWTGNPFLDLYFVPFKKKDTELSYGRVEKFSNDINSKYHDAVVTFNDKQEVVFFTRNNYSGGKSGKDDEGVMRLKVFTAKKKGNGWGSEEGLPFNSDEYSCTHPSLAADGTRLYFASDMPGGFGGMDIYYSELENGRWGPPVNLGASVNTEGNEIFPHISKKGRLYYSSDGQLGLGGLDIYYVDPTDGGQWTSPENVGAPINSKDDDFGISVSDDGTYGFFTSDRNGGSGRDDIYSFSKKAQPLKIFVYDAITKEPLDSALVTSDTCTKRKLYTGKDGKVTIELPFNKCCTFKAAKEGYMENAQQGCTKDATATEETIVEIPLMKEQKFKLEGVVYDQSTGLPLEGAKLTLISDCKADSMRTFTTDATGRYAFPLSQECCYKVRAEKDKYFAQTAGGDTTCTKGLKESKTLILNINLQPTTTNIPEKPATDPLADLDKPAPTPDAPKELGRVKYDKKQGAYVDNAGKPVTGTKRGVVYEDGKIVPQKTQGTVFTPSDTKYTGQDTAQAYFLHVYYDFDQAFLRDESVPELQKLLALMKDNPKFIIEISSHTDARGSNSYNNRLSQRRAESVVRWLIEHGAERDRLVPRGYGENMLSNNCKNNIPCSEKDHQMNRRTEFRVLGGNKEKLSRPNENTRVDKCQGCPF